ncbi:MAG: tetratricopeptide repeat protein, partial [Candidatus Tectomicrobia bacterium]|nr:tetratricopeptide repeat protein [Candidatus Tectomicrobia bacterium]
MNRSWMALVLALALALPTAAYSDTGPTPPPVQLTGSPYDRGRNEVNMGNWGRAAELFQQAVKADPKHYQAYNMLGYALRKTGKPKEALEAYNRALSLKPDYAPAIEYRGEAHL